MRRPGRGTLRPAAWAAWFVVAAWGSSAGGQSTAPAGAPAGHGDLDARAAALSGKVLADPLDAATRDELAAVRLRQRRRDLAAFRALAQGLRAYLQAGPELAAPALKRAAGSARAASLTRSLAKPLSKILKDLNAPGPPAPRKEKTCPKCGGTGLTDCTAHRCYASGRVPCTKCRGVGAIRVENPMLKVPVYFTCSDCGGTGVVGCPVCSATGTVPCTMCKGRPGATWSQGRIPAEEVKQIRQVICKARRLGRGEIDLYTAGALKPSPK